MGRDRDMEGQDVEKKDGIVGCMRGKGTKGEGGKVVGGARVVCKPFVCACGLRSSGTAWSQERHLGSQQENKIVQRFLGY